MENNRVSGVGIYDIKHSNYTPSWRHNSISKEGVEMRKRHEHLVKETECEPVFNLTEFFNDLNTCGIAWCRYTSKHCNTQVVFMQRKRILR